MTDVPPPIASSVAGAPVQARETTAERGVRRAGEAHAADRQLKTVDEMGNTVETTDADSRIFSDAEGAGSQGRFLGEEGEEAPQNPPQQPSAGVTTDPDGKIHLDIEA